MNGIQRHLNEIWWLLTLRALALIIFGVIAVVWPGLTLLALSTAFAAYLIIAGLVDIIAGIRAEGRRSLWFLTLLLGLAEVAVAVYLLKHGLALATFIALLGISLMIIGIVEVVVAFEPGEVNGRRFMLAVAGVLGVIAGFIVLRYPVSSGLAFTWLLGLWGLISGSMQLAMCLAVRTQLYEATS